MELPERIRKLKKSEKEILGGIYWTVIYLAVALFVLFIFQFFLIYNVYIPNPSMITTIFSIIAVIIYTLALIYLIRSGGCIWERFVPKRVLLKAEIDFKEEEKPEVKEEEEE